jgi:predicted nucleic acid-binding protein
MNFADTNWLVSIYMEPAEDDAEGARRREIVSRFLRRHPGQLMISSLVLLEARNIFLRVTGERDPVEWKMIEADFDGRLYVDTMNWDLVRRECNALFSKYAWKAQLGTFDTAIVASAKLAGASRFLSFDFAARTLAAAEGLEVFPELDAAGRSQMLRLKK